MCNLKFVLVQGYSDLTGLLSLSGREGFQQIETFLKSGFRPAFNRTGEMEERKPLRGLV